MKYCPTAQASAGASAETDQSLYDQLNKLISDGIYMKILTEWGEQSGAVSSATTNGAIF